MPPFEKVRTETLLCTLTSFGPSSTILRKYFHLQDHPQEVPGPYGVGLQGPSTFRVFSFKSPSRPFDMAPFVVRTKTKTVVAWSTQSSPGGGSAFGWNVQRCTTTMRSGVRSGGDQVDLLSSRVAKTDLVPRGRGFVFTPWIPIRTFFGAWSVDVFLTW